MLISKGKFLSYQSAFYKRIMATPYKVQLEVVEVSKKSDDFMDSFVGDSERSSKLYEFRALYEKEISNRTREKYGLPKEVSGVIYLSPKQLTPIFGDYHLNWNTTKVHFEGRTQVIDRIIYLEELTDYKSCIGLQIFIKDDSKGG